MKKKQLTSRYSREINFNFPVCFVGSTCRLQSTEKKTVCTQDRDNKRDRKLSFHQIAWETRGDVEVETFSRRVAQSRHHRQSSRGCVAFRQFSTLFAFLAASLTFLIKFEALGEAAAELRASR